MTNPNKPSQATEIPNAPPEVGPPTTNPEVVPADPRPEQTRPEEQPITPNEIPNAPPREIPVGREPTEGDRERATLGGVTSARRGTR